MLTVCRDVIRASLSLWVVAPLLIGCVANVPVVYDNRIYHRSWPNFFTGAPGQEFLAVIHGDPFPGRERETEAIILYVADKAFNNSAYSFSTNPPEIDSLAPRFTIILGPGASAHQAPCGNLDAIDPTAVSSDGRLEVHAALCRGTAPLTRARGRLNSVDSPDDPQFRQLIFQVANKVFEKEPTGQPTPDS
jgi:hypothetical protein